MILGTGYPIFRKTLKKIVNEVLKQKKKSLLQISCCRQQFLIYIFQKKYLDEIIWLFLYKCSQLVLVERLSNGNYRSKRGVLFIVKELEGWV